MMAVRKATRSNSSAQPKRHRPDNQLKADVFETLRHLNRGFGVALSAFDRLENKDRAPGARFFAVHCLRDYRSRTEELQALANRDLVRLLAGHEDQDASRFGSINKSRVSHRKHQY
jgi:hypothetical protein